MVDSVSKKKRSEIMGKVKSKGSKIENAFAKILRTNGFSYTRNATKYFGKPDFVLKKYKTVVFIDSCFWHGCKQHCRIPSVRKKYWIEKIVRNVARDKEVSKYYKKQGRKIFRIWEHRIKKNKNIQFDKFKIT